MATNTGVAATIAELYVPQGEGPSTGAIADEIQGVRSGFSSALEDVSSTQQLHSEALEGLIET